MCRRLFFFAIVLMTVALAAGCRPRPPGYGSGDAAARRAAKSDAKCRRCHYHSGPLGAVAPARSSSSVVEPFAGPDPRLDWLSFPRFSPDPFSTLRRSDAPNKDGWVGNVDNESLGGFAALAYSGNPDMTDYSIEAWVYTKVTSNSKGPINAIAIRVDPRGERFYRLGAHFTSEPKLTLAYVGADVNNFPVYLRQWGPEEVPGGIPKQGGWHRMKIVADGDQLSAFWDGRPLPGGPVKDTRIASGYFGIYANFVGTAEVTETLADAVVVDRSPVALR